MKACRWLYSLVALVATGAAAADEGTSLTLLTEENPPYNFVGAKTGEIEGSAVEIVAALMAGADISYSLKLLPWNRAFRETVASTDTCLFVVNRTPEREDLFQWVGPLIGGGWAIYRRPGSTIRIESLADLKGHTIAGKMGSASVDTLEREAGVEVVRTGKDERAARMLYHGRADLWVSGVIDAPAATRAIGLPPPELALLWKPADLSLACNISTSPALIAKLNAVNRTLDELRKKALAQHTAGLALPRKKRP
ncbi:substrate-binding periplasmic protein [Kordiimonas aestuarii]|uniref:substrate-binding periplasmic protein n=1 Tax=Kordiimonas aestuarii TaxID=1005925 RepID=UPI0021CDFA95|nr:ABC transporter substrate-binding protein [Kordiimonas aestuarii]